MCLLLSPRLCYVEQSDQIVAMKCEKVDARRARIPATSVIRQVAELLVQHDNSANVVVRLVRLAGVAEAFD